MTREVLILRDGHNFHRASAQLSSDNFGIDAEVTQVLVNDSTIDKVRGRSPDKIVLEADISDEKVNQIIRPMIVCGDVEFHDNRSDSSMLTEFIEN